MITLLSLENHFFHKSSFSFTYPSVNEFFYELTVFLSSRELLTSVPDSFPEVELCGPVITEIFDDLLLYYYADSAIYLFFNYFKK